MDKLEIIKLLHELGFSSKLKGFNYLRDMINEVLHNDINSFKMNELYSFISIKYNSSINNVTKCIRESINKSWVNANRELTDLVFGYSTGYNNDCPTNSLFLNSIIDYMKLLFNSTIPSE